MTQQTHDIGETVWFRLVTGTIWLLVAVFTAVGIYTINPEAVTGILTSGYFLSTLLFGGFLLVVAYLIFRQYPIRTPSRDTERYTSSR
ncbi:hypothetical protein ACLI4U_08645 [Natrialbaceae archaeon A-CW2]|uniref:hypothetical protein n=1 Tax=Natronosalvus amylolyticus TaxID=2961994 RepID=UPI0020C98F18|nr:hypothetical protein [Natronosalvus amylolyticus]